VWIGEYPGFEFVVGHADVLAATIVESFAEIIYEVRMQFSVGMKFYLIYHTWKVDESVNRLIGAS
jgi:hypothetical protein